MKDRILFAMTYAIVGLGRSGSAARRLLLRRGVSPDEIVTFDDKAPADFADSELMMRERRPGTLVVSPGVPLAKPWIRKAAADGVRVTSELSLALEDLNGERIVAVTGSVGKSTTVAAIAAAAKAADPHAFLGGNFGIPLAEYAADVLEGRRPRARWLILELSSFQLENADGLRPDIGVIVSFTANHMERYESLEEYYGTKWRLVGLSRGPVFLNARSRDLMNYARRHPGGWSAVDRDDPSFAALRLFQSALIGSHNQDNLALAAAVAGAAGWGDDSIQAMKTFAGLPHRLQSVGEKNGVHFVNDSKATAIDSVLIAIASAVDGREHGRVIVLLGGKDKNLPWQDLSPWAKNPRVCPIWFGECAALAHRQSGWNGPEFKTLAEAFREAVRNSSPGDVVLLSPGGSSLDEFKNFEDRGHSFARLVQAL